MTIKKLPLFGFTAAEKAISTLWSRSVDLSGENGFYKRHCRVLGAFLPPPFLPAITAAAQSGTFTPGFLVFDFLHSNLIENKSKVLFIILYIYAEYKEIHY